MDRQTRITLDIKPWQPVVVGRDPYHALSLEFNHVASGIALAALGGAIVIPEDILGISWLGPLASFLIVLLGLVTALLLIWLKIRSRI